MADFYDAPDVCAAYLAAVQAAGFAVTRLSECAPVRERFDGDAEELARRRRIPPFLLLPGTRG